MAEMPLVNKEDEYLYLPPGFRFHPTDEEVITNYLIEKVANPSFTTKAMGEVDLNKCEPWDLPSKAKMGEKEWYFFCQKDMKYPTGLRTNRATKAGYWKATGKDKEIYRGKGVLVGMKKTLVFYMGRAPKGEKSNWVIHEFRLEGKSKNINLKITPKDEWVVCRVHHKNNGNKRNQPIGDDFVDDSGFMDTTYFSSNNLPSSSASQSIQTDSMSQVNEFLVPNNFSHMNTSHISQTIQVATQNQAWMLSGLPSFGYLHQEQPIVNPMVVPKIDIGNYQYNNVSNPNTKGEVKDLVSQYLMY